jgi:hypothetical protein
LCVCVWLLINKIAEVMPYPLTGEAHGNDKSGTMQ